MLTETFVEVPEVLDQLRPRGQAFWVASIQLDRVRGRPAERARLAKLVDEGRTLVARAVKVLEVLGYTDRRIQSVLQRVQPGRGRHDCANDLAVLYPVLLEQRERIEAANLLPEGTIERINELPLQLVEVNDPLAEPRARDLRDRAFTLLHEAVKTTVLYLQFLIDIGRLQPRKLPRLSGR